MESIEILAKKSNDLVGFLQLEWSKNNPWHKPLAHKPTQKNLQKSEWERWLIPNYMYSKKFFPKFLSGSGYLVTHKASKCLFEMSKTIPIVHLEDVYITGLCAESCNLRRKHNRGFHARKMENPPLSQYKLKLTDVTIHKSTGQMDQLLNQTIHIHNQTIQFFKVENMY